MRFYRHSSGIRGMTRPPHYLDPQTSEETPQLLPRKTLLHSLVRQPGLEPGTPRLKVWCSEPTELLAHMSVFFQISPTPLGGNRTTLD